MSLSKSVAIADLQAIFESYLENVRRYVIIPIELWEAMDYSLSNGVKRLRPSMLLAVLAIQTLDRVPQGLATALALESIQTYSLIHDDLPAMDNDDLRRGQPTNHIKFGEDRAILAGDALLTDAFGLITDDPGLTDSVKVELISRLSKAAGSTGMVLGQVRDLEAEGLSINLEALEANHQLKTGALFDFALQAGGLIAGLKDEELTLLKEFSQHYGIAYQIHNDLKDVVGSEESTGKQVGQDQAEDKTTYPSLLGIDQSRQLLAERISASQAVVDQLNEQSGKDYSLLLEFNDYLVLA